MATEKKININTATKEDLDGVPQMAGQRSESVIHYREQHGPFKRVEDISNVPGIGDVMASQLNEYFEVGGEADDDEGGRGGRGKRDEGIDRAASRNR